MTVEKLAEKHTMAAEKQVSAIILMADYGSDPTETVSPYTAFVEAGFTVHFGTEKGASPHCDSKLLSGLTQKVLGATQTVIKQYETMKQSDSWKNPKAWSDKDFSLDGYDLVFFPGGHDKAMRQIIDAPVLQPHVARYFPQTLKSDGNKTMGAICHGVQALSRAKYADGKSVLHDVTTTALPAWMERFAYYGTKAWLGDYYKTYGAGSENVEKFVKDCLDDKGEKQWRDCMFSFNQYVIEDPNYSYLSGRWPGDAGMLAERVVERVKERTAVKAQ